jgi:hypothetical protein
VIEPVAAAICASNAKSASEWASQQPEGPARDAAARGLSRGLVQFYPDEALLWASAVSDLTERAALQSDVIAAVYDENTVRGRRLLEASNLLPETKAAIAARLSAPDFKPPSLK